jgi:hypothetical protein
LHTRPYRALPHVDAVCIERREVEMTMAVEQHRGSIARLAAIGKAMERNPIPSLPSTTYG